MPFLNDRAAKKNATESERQLLTIRVTPESSSSLPITTVGYHASSRRQDSCGSDPMTDVLEVMVEGAVVGLCLYLSPRLPKRASKE